MVRRIVRSVTAMLVLAVVLQGGVALADHDPKMVAVACVSDTGFEFHLTGNLSVNATGNTYVRGSAGLTGAAGQWQLTVRLAPPSSVTVTQNVGVLGDGTRWATGTFPIEMQVVNVPSASEFYWYYDFTVDGVIPHGTNPYTSSDVWGFARFLDSEAGFVFDANGGTSLPITDCEGTTTTTGEVTTSSSVPPTVAPTSIVSTTVPETTTIPEVETDIPNGDSTRSVMPVLVAVGFLTLVIATIRARRLER